jgi:SlyX protein
LKATENNPVSPAHPGRKESINVHEVNMTDLNTRIIELETRSAEQQLTIDELSDMIARQWQKIDEMTALTKSMRGKIQTLEERLPEDDVPPPHY